MCTVCYFQRDYFKKNVTVLETVEGIFLFVLICFALKRYCNYFCGLSRKAVRTFAEAPAGASIAQGISNRTESFSPPAQQFDSSPNG